MAAISWVKAIIGLFLTWVTFVIVSVFYGTVIAAKNLVITEVNNTGMVFFPKEINDAINSVTEAYNTGLRLLMFLVIIGFSAYIIINSIRRRVDEEVSVT